MMDENSFVMLTKNLNILAEIIRTRQEEKQAVLDEFDKEKERYSKGKIPEKTFSNIVKKTNKEVMRLDRSIKDSIQKANMKQKSVGKLIEHQKPKAFRAKEKGIVLTGVSRKKKSTASKKTNDKKSSGKKKSSKKNSEKNSKISKAEIKKEMKAEKKLMK